MQFTISKKKAEIVIQKKTESNFGQPITMLLSPWWSVVSLNSRNPGHKKVKQNWYHKFTYLTFWKHVNANEEDHVTNPQIYHFYSQISAMANRLSHLEMHPLGVKIQSTLVNLKHPRAHARGRRWDNIHCKSGRMKHLNSWFITPAIATTTKIHQKSTIQCIVPVDVQWTDYNDMIFQGNVE